MYVAVFESVTTFLSLSILKYIISSILVFTLRDCCVDVVSSKLGILSGLVCIHSKLQKLRTIPRMSKSLAF